MPLPQHVAWLLANRGDALRAVLDAGNATIAVEAALELLVAADPSPGAHAVQWLFDRLVSGGVRWEDVAAGAASRAGQTLSLFSQHRRALAAGARNLELYPDLDAIERAMVPLVAMGPAAQGGQPPDLGGRALRRAQRLQAYRDSIVLYRGDDLVVAVPQSVPAAQWWGRGTTWCTSGESASYFAGYHRQAPLVVVVMPGVESVPASRHMGKLQLWIGPDGTQFTDAEDREVTPELVAQYWSRLEPVLTWAVEQGAPLAHLVPLDVSSSRVGLLCMQADPRRLARLEPGARTRELCIAAVSSNGCVLQHVPAHLLDHEMCALAVASNGRALEFVPPDLVDFEMCALAILQNGLSARWVPPAMWQCGLAEAVALSRLYSIPAQYLTAELCMQAVRQSGHNLAIIPQQFCTPELYLQAVQSNGCVLDQVPIEYWTPELVMAAVAQDPDVFDELDMDYITPELCRLAVSIQGLCLKSIPRHMRTPELCLLAVQNHGNALRSVPEEHISQEMCWAAVTSYPDSIGHVPHIYRSIELCRSAAGADIDVLRHLRSYDLGTEFYRELVLRKPTALMHIKPQLVTEHMCADAISACPQLFPWIPKGLQTFQMCIDVIKSHPHYISEVPSEFREKVREAARLQVQNPVTTLSSLQEGKDWSADRGLARLAAILARHGQGTQPEPVLLSAATWRA